MRPVVDNGITLIEIFLSIENNELLICQLLDFGLAIIREVETLSHSVINELVRIDFPGIRSEELNGLGDIVINGIQTQTMFLTPLDCSFKRLADPICPKDNAGAFCLFIFAVVKNFLIRSPDAGPLTFLNQCAVKVNGNDFRSHCPPQYPFHFEQEAYQKIHSHSFHRRCVLW